MELDGYDPPAHTSCNTGSSPTPQDELFLSHVFGEIAWALGSGVVKASNRDADLSRCSTTGTDPSALDNARPHQKYPFLSPTSSAHASSIGPRTPPLLPPPLVLQTYEEALPAIDNLDLVSRRRLY